MNQNVFEKECPNVVKAWQDIAMKGYAPENKVHWLVSLALPLIMVGIYDERGRVGLRALEEEYNKEPWNLEKLFDKEENA